jgi:hypothetical protein
MPPEGLLTVEDILSVDLAILSRCEELWVLMPSPGSVITAVWLAK